MGTHLFDRYIVTSNVTSNGITPLIGQYFNENDVTNTFFGNDAHLW
jgi:hypothetical protein